ncbi:MAG: DUF2478 domain-containing protein [Hyphomicrobiales bacterium]|nr:DUF2478 domain-containing protein [Novosphingobium sp.]MCC2097321.1 DUF2478 domain-containing protein [Hyphomicrobiales bacterium]
MTDDQIALSAVRFGDGDRIDELLEAVACTVRARGYTVAGYLQREICDGPGCCPATFLENIANGEFLRISQDLGPGSRSCRLDPRALADVTGKLLASLDANTQLLVLNRFGKGESDGHGFRSAIERACELGVPVLNAVRASYEPAWNAFAGGFGAFLVPDAAIATQWAFDAIACRRRAIEAA